MNNQTKKPPMGGIEPSKGPMSVEKAKDFKGTTKKLLNNYLSKYKIAIIIVIIFSTDIMLTLFGLRILMNLSLL